MNVTKKDKIITIELTEEERKAVDYFIIKRGVGILNEYFSHFIDSRVVTMQMEMGRDLYQASTEEEKKKILERIL
jgi:hypothetical protein